MPSRNLTIFNSPQLSFLFVCFRFLFLFCVSKLVIVHIKVPAVVLVCGPWGSAAGLLSPDVLPPGKLELCAGACSIQAWTPRARAHPPASSCLSLSGSPDAASPPHVLNTRETWPENAAVTLWQQERSFFAIILVLSWFAIQKAHPSCLGQIHTGRRTWRAMQCKQMGPVAINASVHTACKQHQRKNIPICASVASRVLCELGLMEEHNLSQMLVSQHLRTNSQKH